MEHFPSVAAKSIRDVPQATCIAFAMEEGICVGITLQPRPSTDDETIAVLWTSRKETCTPRVIDVASISGDEVVVFPSAKVLLPIDPTHMRFRYRERVEPFGALFLSNGEPYVLVRGLTGGSVAVRLRDGVHADIGISNLPWFPSWGIATPDINGSWSRICDVEWKSQVRS